MTERPLGLQGLLPRHAWNVAQHHQDSAAAAWLMLPGAGLTGARLGTHPPRRAAAELRPEPFGTHEGQRGSTR